MNTFLWQVRRELWEARSVWLVPAGLATVVVGATLIGSLLSHRIDLTMMDAETVAKLTEKATPEKLDMLAGATLASMAGLFLFVAAATQFFYAADALYGERRDRSILFWRSLPVSDASAVLAKLGVALVIIPTLAVLAALVAQLGVFAIASAKLAPVTLLNGHLWNAGVWAGALKVDLFALIGAMLWWLPPVGFALAVSAWAPRSPIAWAILLPIGVGIAEWLAFHTHFVWFLLMRRAVDLMPRLFSDHSPMVLDGDTIDLGAKVSARLDFASFLGAPELWAGLAIGAGLVAGAIWLRRYRDTTA